MSTEDFKQVEDFIHRLNNGSRKISPKANEILVSNDKGGQQTLANKLADAIKEYNCVLRIGVIPNPAAIILCKASIDEALSYGVVEFIEDKRGTDVLPLLKDESKIRIEIIPGHEPIAKISGQHFSLDGKLIELDFGNPPEGRLNAMYVSNNVTNYNISASNASVTHNQSITQNSIIDSFNSLIKKVDNSTYHYNDKEEIKSYLKEIKTDLESKDIVEGISKVNKLKKFEKFYKLALPWAIMAAGVI